MEQIDRDELRRLAALVDPGDVTGDEALGRIVAAVPQLLADLETVRTLRCTVANQQAEIERLSSWIERLKWECD